MKKLLMTAGFLMFTILAMQAQTSAKENGPEIKFTSLEYDYGTITQGANGDCIFKFRNVGNEVLVITDVRKSCGCTMPVWSKEPVLPGHGGEIKVGYDTKLIGQFSKTITVLTNGLTPTVTLTIKGNVTAK